MREESEVPAEQEFQCRPDEEESLVSGSELSFVETD